MLILREPAGGKLGALPAPPMAPPLHALADGLLVAVGAVPGAWLRYRLLGHYGPLLAQPHWATLVLNSVACLALGLLLGWVGSTGSWQHGLMVVLGTGFLGSLSTFSTVVAEMEGWLRQRRPSQAFALLVASLLVGVLALRCGLLLARAIGR
ncbi:MAG: CrcB family protein [Cyanobacteriota bacterium]|jgi:CrcB protein|nr:CrcB family protein [Cyanobacteriota bacterium]